MARQFHTTASVVLTASREQEARALALPIALASLLPSEWPLDHPLARIQTCGCSPIVIEVLQGFDGQMQPRYAPPDEHLWSIPGMATASILLEMLASQPGCVVSQDWLMQGLRQRRKAMQKSQADDDENDEDDEELKRPDNVVSLLRKLLYPPALLHLPERSQRAIRLYLVAHVKASRESGPSYRLAGAPSIWLDVEAIETCARQVKVLEQFGENALHAWQAISEIGLRGSFLPHEPYCDWAQWRRARVSDLLWQSVDTQQQRARQQKDQPAGEETALQLLLAFWRAHLTNQDAFRQLAELLGKREHFQQAEECYAQLCSALENDGRELHEQTKKVMEFVRAKQIQRKECVRRDTIQVTESSQATLPQLKSSQQSVLPRFSYDVFQSAITKRDYAFQGKPLEGDLAFIEKNSNDEVLNSLVSSLPNFPPFQNDTDIFAHLSTILSKPFVAREGELTYFDQQTRLYWRAREETALPTPTLYTYVIRHINDLNTLLASSHLPMLRSYLCEIVSRTVLLSGILLYDMGQYAKARQAYQVAFQAATEANNVILQAIIWGWMSFTWTYDKHYVEALRCIQHACTFANRTTDLLTQAWLGAIEAEIQSHLGNLDACLQALSSMERGTGIAPSQDTSYLFEFNPVLLLGYKGVCLQQFYQRQDPTTHSFLQEAKAALEQALASEAPIKRKLYYLNDLAGVYARQGEVEIACTRLIQSIPLIMHIGGGSKTIQKHLVQVRTLLQPYEDTFSVQTLDEQIAPLFIEMPLKKT